MDIWNLLFNNFDNVLVILGLGTLLFYILKYGKKEDLFSLIMSLMLESEKLYGSGTGVGKQKDVLSKIPVLFKIIYGNNEIKNIINKYAKEYKEVFDNISSS